jgi:hypothetical protein
MMIVTPQGISDADWDRVKELAVAIVNATQDDEEGGETETDALMTFLDSLEKKYGSHPGILSTRADFLSDPDEAVALLEEAYTLAVDRKDARSRLYIADTLAGTFIRELEDADAGETWLQRVAEELKSTGDEGDITSYEELRVDLQRLRAGD